MQETDLKKILVVDDDPADRKLLREILSKKYTVIEASNGEEALVLARSENPDLVLMDIMMPKIDGYTACSIIKKDPFTAEIPVVMLSGLKDELNVKLADKAGAAGYITKPVYPQQLLDNIGQFL